ncbi:GL12992 [Drosophila persimilis]|uniref:GL12992 n=2 Tax=Drosophila persimilis TaxID=7234 RepID=B4GVD3_DROPE|nr:GL12992 [Drosophila persimilis]
MQGPCYAGICLPKNVLDLFPTRNLSRTYVSRDIQDQDLMGINLLLSQRLQFLNDSLNNEGGDESSVISSLSDVSSASRRQPRQWQQGAKHARSQCLHCARSPRQQRQDSVGSQSNGAGGGGGATLAPCELYSSAAAALVAAGIQAGPVLAKKSSGSGGSGSGRVPLGTDISFHSPESMLSEDSLPDRLTASILYNVQRLANPVSAKQSKMALLELKQKHPHAFQDICLYSESCKTLGRSSYRMSARRFLQELFLDLNFDAFYVEPQLIIGTRKMPAEEKAEPTPPSAMLLAHKTQMKPKPAAQLASVYETSWENLLMDQSPRMVVTKSPSANAQQASQQQMMPHNQLHIEDDTEDTLEDSEDEEEGDENEDDDPGEDVCDGSGAGTQASSVTTAHTALPCHGNSNRSSICTISQQPVPQPSAVPGGGGTGTAGTNLKNDNRQYTRGRFYTLELDLSCTKNKFPIKDRSQTTPPKTSPTPVPQLKRQMSADADADADADTDAGVVSSISVAPGSTSSTLDYSTVTKSLAASMTKPVGSLYCEKRLQSSKSEAVLDARPGAGPASGTGGGESAVGGSSRNGSVKWTLKRVTS